MNEIRDEQGKLTGYDEPAFTPDNGNKKVAITGGVRRDMMSIAGSKTGIGTTAMLQAIAEIGNGQMCNGWIGSGQNRDGYRGYVRTGANAKVKAKRRKAVKKAHKRK